MASITLDRDLIFNVYVPVTDVLTALEFAGKTVDLASLERTEIDGTEYYVDAAAVPDFAVTGIRCGDSFGQICDRAALSSDDAGRLWLNLNNLYIRGYIRLK